MYETFTFTSTTVYTGPGPKNGIVNSGMDIHGPQRMISSKSQKHNMPIQTNNISVISAHPVNKKKTTDTSTY